MIPDSLSRFLWHTDHTPQAPAVVIDEDVTSYQTLGNMARGFAGCFSVRKEPKVLVVLPPGPEAYAAMFGAALAGGYYAPVNLRSPIERLQQICSSFEPDFIVSSQDVFARLREKSRNSVWVDPAYCEEGFDGHALRPSLNKIAYVIFTSGSTGVPKGVVVTRAGLDHYVNWIGNDISPTGCDRWSQYASIAFDLSVLEIYGALCFGGSLYPVLSTAYRLFPLQMIESERLTIWVSVPSAVSLMMKAGEIGEGDCSSLRRAVFCGEPLHLDQVEFLFKRNSSLIVQNTYGPTEATVSMTSLHLTPERPIPSKDGIIPIGHPIDGMTIDVIPHGDPTRGELVISGPQVARGYWQDDSRTRASFAENEKGAFSFRTGDIVTTTSGHIYFENRADFQIKHRGFRIETGEIVGALHKAGFARACVIHINNRLVAVVEANPAGFGGALLRKKLTGNLEPYAVPDDILAIDRFPVTENGKVDRAALSDWCEGTLCRQLNFNHA